MKQAGKHFHNHEEVMEGLRKVDLKEVATRLEGKVPANVLSLLHAGTKSESRQPFEESSLEKARKVLNELVEKAWKELDDKIIECKEFEEKNRGTYDQVVTDIARIGEDIADFIKEKGDAQECINVKEQEIIELTAVLKTETEIYMKNLLEDQREMKIRKADLAVFQFMMQLTKCPSSSSFVQLSQGGRAMICQTKQGLMLDFGNKKTMAEIERRMTPSARRAIHELLESVQASQAQRALSFLQEKALRRRGVDDGSDEDREADDPPATTPAPVATPEPAPPRALAKEKVQKDPNPGWSAYECCASDSCNGGPPDCGLLHDKMSLLWGEYKDKVDELQQHMDKEEFEFEETKYNLNTQIEVTRNQKATCVSDFNQAVADIAAAKEEMSQKEEEARDLDHDYQEYMEACRKRIYWIKYQDYCSYVLVRALTMKYSSVSPPEKIVDCGVTDWVPGECSVSCDDECPDPTDPYGCGGWQTLAREIIVAPNEFGIKCPALLRKKKCNQIKCPVDCEMSKWSVWSTCSSICEGTQAHTRNVQVQPKNGGMSCNTVQESRPCIGNPRQCDRNCRLKRWSRWSPCSVACSGGYTEKWRRVTVTAHGKGRCPKETSKYRYRMRKCNTFDCTGDEICIAKQDLIMSIDASGSLQEDGFKVIKGFTLKLIEKYKGEYFGYEDMKIGIVQFGNGEIVADGSVSKALSILQLTSDMAKVRSALEGLEYKKGFTNMAQAFTEAENILLLGSRRKAQSAVLTLTDGKPSFKFMTHEKVMQLKDKHIKLFFAPVVDFEGDELELMKEWATQPWETHLVHIPGLEPLQADEEVFAQRMLVQFCPEPMSPSAMMYEEEEIGYMLVRENGLCE